MTISAAASAAEDFPTEDYRKLAEEIAQQFFGREDAIKVGQRSVCKLFHIIGGKRDGAYLSVPFLDQKRD
jgi:hypothetical protein